MVNFIVSKFNKLLCKTFLGNYLLIKKKILKFPKMISILKITQKILMANQVLLKSLKMYFLIRTFYFKVIVNV